MPFAARWGWRSVGCPFSGKMKLARNHLRVRYEAAVAMRYKVVLRKSEEGFSVHCPTLPGCWSQGKTAQQAIGNIQDAIREYLAAKWNLHDKRT